ncbi:MAG: 30S ribosome-binding factor RbfA [Armatimonadetes bacterium]|nr:30S ribosome-binding factor RbfA [Armatimonadota bacterium]
MNLRQEKLREFLKEEVSRVLREEIKDPRLGFVTVTDAEVSRDYQHAKIYVSIFGSEEQKEQSRAALQSATKFVRSAVGRYLRLRLIPELVFVVDTAVDHSMKIAELLRDIEKETPVEETPDSPDR